MFTPSPLGMTTRWLAVSGWQELRALKGFRGGEPVLVATTYGTTESRARIQNYAECLLGCDFCQGRWGRSLSGKSRLRMRSYLYSSLTVPSDSL